MNKNNFIWLLCPFSDTCHAIHWHLFVISCFLTADVFAISLKMITLRQLTLFSGLLKTTQCRGYEENNMFHIC